MRLTMPAHRRLATGTAPAVPPAAAGIAPLSHHSDDSESWSLPLRGQSQTGQDEKTRVSTVPGRR